MNAIYYREQGEGPILVFLHGFCETHKIWEEFTPYFLPHFKVVSLDLPGFGKSPMLKSPFTIKDVGQCVIELLISKGIQKCVLIGHSMGGYVALAIADARPDLIVGLCLFHSTALADSEEKKINRSRVMEFVRKNGVQPFIETFVSALFYQKDQNFIDKVYKIASKTSKKAVLGYSGAMRDRPDSITFLQLSQIPILFLAGKQDSVISVETLQEQVQKSSKGRIIVLAETGHMGMFEQAAQAAQALKDFFKDLFWF